MKLKLYTTSDNERVRESVKIATEYFKDHVEFSPLSVIERMEKDKTLYEKILSWGGMLLKLKKSISTDFLMSLPSDGYDGLVLFVDKSKAYEESGLYGQHSRRGEKSFIEVYDSKKYVKYDKAGIYSYTSSKIINSGYATTNILIHEIMHALSDHYAIPDILHQFISEGQFRSYLNYLEHNLQNMHSNQEKLYKTALACVGKDITPKDEIPDVVACAAQVNAVHKIAFEKEIGGGASTYWLYDALKKSALFEKVLAPSRGDIVISPTGHAGKGGQLSNGHVGIVGDNGVIMSNDSRTGLFSENFTIEKWNAYYGVKGKFPVYYFKRK